MYYVYENWTAEKKAVVHTGDCPYCRSGHGFRPNKHGDRNGRWHGGFASYADARDFAVSLPDRDVRDCRHCCPAS